MNRALGNGIESIAGRACRPHSTPFRLRQSRLKNSLQIFSIYKRFAEDSKGNQSQQTDSQYIAYAVALSVRFLYLMTTVFKRARS